MMLLVYGTGAGSAIAASIASFDDSHTTAISTGCGQLFHMNDMGAQNCVNDFGKSFDIETRY